MSHRLKSVPREFALIDRTFEGKRGRCPGSKRGDRVGELRGTHRYDGAGSGIAGRPAVGGVRSPVVWRREPVLGDDHVAGRQLDAVRIAVRRGNVGVSYRVSNNRTGHRIGGSTDTGRVADAEYLVQPNKAGIEAVNRLVVGCWG